MDPTVGEVDLHTVDIVDLGAVVLCKHLLDLHEDGVNIGLGGEVDAILGYLVVGEGGAQFAGRAAFLCE